MLETWYERKPGPTFNPKKGRKLVRMQRTANGVQSDYVGYEKKIPKSWLKKQTEEGTLKE